MRILSKLPPGEIQLFLKQRFNIAPTQDAPIITLEAGSLLSMDLPWGLRAPWSKAPLINAQAESLTRKPIFRDAFQKHRCLVPADGFYEWRKSDKAPFRFTRPDEQPFCFAGLWDESPGPEPRRAFTILTTAASDVVQPIHHRMPLALASGQYDDWLADPVKAAAIARQPCPVPFRADPVSSYVNKSSNDDPRCLEPPEKELF